MKKILDSLLKQRIFFVFLFLSFTLWYISRLSHDFTTKVAIELDITTDSHSDYWIEDPHLTINVTAEGDGRILSLYKLGLQRPISIESSSLRFVPTKTPYTYTINAGSLIRAIAKREPRLSISNIEDSTITVRLSKLASQRIPVDNQVKVNCRRQYMTVGGVRLAFDSVDVKAPQIILDTLKFIPTEKITFDNITSNVQGKASLLFPDNVYSAKSTVAFAAEVAGFTEMQFDLPISVKNLPAYKSALVVPSSIILKVQVPLDKYTQSVNPQAVIDYAQAIELGAQTPVIVDSLPFWAEIVYMYPKFVEPLFTNSYD